MTTDETSRPGPEALDRETKEPDVGSVPDAEERTQEAPAGGRSRSVFVAAGILLSRLSGLVREQVLAFYLGTSPQMDVFRLALRAPNLLQNLLGEGTLSASFIPVYTRLLDEGRPRDAGRFAGAIFGLLLAVAGLVALLGVLLAEPLVSLVAPGFRLEAAALGAEGASSVDRFALAVTAVRITFPMTGVLVLYAWTLGVLNSHRRFFLSYVAPVLWNGAIISALVAVAYGWLGGGLETAAGTVDHGLQQGPEALNRLLIAAAVGALVGGVLQFLIQVPAVVRVIRGFRLSLSLKVEGVKKALSAFGPLVAGRGVVQLAGYLDVFLASFLAPGALAALGFAQTLYLLPISLFAMAVAAAELPELSRGAGPDPRRVERALAQVTLPTVATAVGYVLFGPWIAGALFGAGAFDRESIWLVSLVLAAYSLGLVATNLSRVLQNVFFALSDTATPAKIAALRVGVAALVAVPLMGPLDRVGVGAVAGWLTGALDGLGLLDSTPGGVGLEAAGGGSGLRLGALALALGSAVGAWTECLVLLGAARRRVDGLASPWGRVLPMVLTALAALAPALLVAWLLPPAEALPLARISGPAAVVGTFALAYLAIAWWRGFPELETWVGRVLRRRR